MTMHHCLLHDTVAPMRHGFLLVDKPKGLTSHDVVAAVRRQLSEKDIGHLGTLDPLATGLLVLAVGKKALKVVELFSDLSKTYDASVLFGAVSTTYDAEGTIERREPPKGWMVPDEIIIQCMIADRFVGKIQQVPPAYSAIHIGGERAYHKARQGRGVNIPPREVEITSCDILSYSYPKLALRVACGSGTYIRSLAHDLGDLLKCGGYLEALRRTSVGAWSVEDAVSLDRVSWAQVIPLKEILRTFAKCELSQEEFAHLSCGRDIAGEVTYPAIGWFDDLPVALLEMKNAMVHARKVL